MENRFDNRLTTSTVFLKQHNGDEQGRRFIEGPDCPRSLSIFRIPEEYRPTLDDWNWLQGGMPKVTVLRWDAYHRRPISYLVDHDYMEGNEDFPDGPKVSTSGVMLQDDFPNPIYYKVRDGRLIGFPVAMVWAKHGKPCLERSNSFGYGYR